MGASRPIPWSNGEIAERYRAGTSLTEIALRMRSSHYIIKAILEAQGVHLRSAREAQRLALEDRKQRRARLRARLDATRG